MTEDTAKITPNSRAWRRVAEYLRNAKLAPRSTMPSSARSNGTTSVDIVAANDSGNPVHQITST